MTGNPEETDTPSPGSSAAEDLEATPQLIDRLHSAGVLSSKARVDALTFVNGPLAWWPWVEKTLLFLGLALTLSGVVCFFAWNWDALSGLAKLGIIQATIVGCCVTAWLKKIETLPGQAAITAAAVLVGVFLAVFGQIYQTGADAYQLFVGWALLILPWVVMCRLAGLWILWLAIVNLAVALFWEQTIDPRGIDSDWLALILGLLNGTAASLREILTERGSKWLSVWMRWILVPASLIALVVPGFVIISRLDDASLAAWCGLAGFLLCLAAIYWQFRIRKPDLFVLTCAATAITVLSCGVVIRVVMEVGDEVPAFFLSGLGILILVAMMAHWLMKTGREVRNAAAATNAPDNSEVDFKKGASPESTATTDDPEEATTISLGNLLAQLSEQGHTIDIESANEIARTDQSEDSTPWFVSALVGFGAWLSCILFLGALAIAGLFDHGAAAVFIGLCLLGGGAFLDRVANGAFICQLALAAGLTGLGLTAIGVAEATHANELSTITLSVATATAVFYAVYRCIEFRFLACLISTALATFWMCEDSWFSGKDSGENWGVHFLVLLETVGIGLIFSRREQSLLRPAGYALAVGLLGTMLITQISNDLQTWPSAMILAVAQVGILTQAWQTTSQNSKQNLGVAIAGTIVLGIVSAPGVIASLATTLLGHLKRDDMLRRLGILSLPIYISAYYYNLETSLLLKSLTLIGSGVILWAARWYFRRQIEQNNLTALETQP